MTIGHVSVFSMSTQQLLYVTQGHISNIADYADADHALFAGIYDASYCCSVDGLTVSAKMDVPYVASATTLIADGIAAINLTGLPADTVLTVLEESETEAAGAIDFSVNLIGSYDLLLTHPNHLDTTITVTAT